MPIATRTWGEVEIGDIVRDKEDHLWWVRGAWPTNHPEGRLGILVDNGTKKIEVYPLPATPVDIYVPTEAEAANLVIAELGGRVLKMIEEREHTIARAQTWRLQPLPAVATAIRDHLDMIHQVPVDDVLRRWQGTVANPATKKTRAEALAELREAHEWAHEHPDQFPQSFPHVHNLEARP